MLSRTRRRNAVTALVALVSFGWTTCGGEVWAQSGSVSQDPAQALRRLADDPRLPLSKVERAQMRRYARAAQTGAEAPPAVADPTSVSGADAEGEAAEAMHAMAAELDLVRAGRPERRAEEASRLARRLRAMDQKLRRKSAETSARLASARLSRAVLDRQQAADARYRGEIQAVLQALHVASKNKRSDEVDAALAAAAGRLVTSTDERPQAEEPLDPSRLPFRRAQPVQRAPGEGPPLPDARADAAALRAPANTASASLIPPTPADLAETEDAQITPEIRALAASLGNQPVRIYTWVHDNIHFLPTYGSVQGSQMTLQAKRGNAFDTASLLVALLRAAGVPARYVTGTVQVPAAAVLNWVGGAASAEVAQQILGQGGVPNIGLSNGQTITHIRLDHVWVEAFVDNVPSRGAVQRQGDAWVPIDASFKQYQFTPRSNLFTDNPISAVLDPGDQLFDVDEALGRISNVRDEALDQRLETWVAQSDQYINGNGVERSREGLLGRKTVVPQPITVFAASLPYQILQRGSAVSVLPAGLRHSVTLNAFATSFDHSLGTAAFSVRLSLPQLNSRRLGIQFDPATPADADVLAAARNGGASSLPVYLVDVVPTIKLDGTTLGAGGAVQMGSGYFFDVVFQGPDGPTTIAYQVVAGDEIVVGITGNGVAKEVVEKRFAANPVDNAPEYLHQVQLHYWMETDYLGELAASGFGVHMQRLPSVGFFSSPLSVSYFFGAPRSGVYESRIMDVKHSLMGAAGTEPARVVNFMKQAGYQGSYLEGAIFDQLETIGNPTPSNRGISAIHLINAALSQDIPLYRITSANAAAALPLLGLSFAVESDISLAVSQGKTVLTPERNVNFGTWQGVGYIIHDESTGAGAYLISGGLAGGGLIDCLKKLIPRFIEVLEFVLAAILLILLIILIAAALAALVASSPAWGTAGAAAVLLLLLLRGVNPISPAPSSA